MSTKSIRQWLVPATVVACCGLLSTQLVAQGGASPEAAAPAAQACSSPEHRQFDFWLGRWTVVDAVGDTVGTNEIVRVADGCGLRETWRSAQGGSGTSLNMYDPQARRWQQVWVGGDGLILHLSGGLEDGAMVLSGERAASNGLVVLDRIRWTPLDDGAVRQLWRASIDGGETWQTVFDGTYHRR